MRTYRYESVVRAPLSEVWSFQTRIEGLTAVTPSFLDLRVEDVRRPDGEGDGEELVEGTEVDLSMKPLGVGPRRSWTSRITERSDGDDRATFVDEMVDGPFPTWEHTHRVVASDEGTVLADRVRYELPGGRLGRAVGPLAVVGFDPMFRYRHRRTRELLE